MQPHPIKFSSELEDMQMARTLFVASAMRLWQVLQLEHGPIEEVVNALTGFDLAAQRYLDASTLVSATSHLKLTLGPNPYGSVQNPSILVLIGPSRAVPALVPPTGAPDRC